MKVKILFFVLMSTILLNIANAKNPKINIETELGNIIIELYEKEAPITVSNFLSYVDSNKFENSSFYRTVTMNNQPNNKIKIEVIQGGLYDDEKMLPPIIHETNDKTGILHKDGIFSMARSEPGTATSEFFICIGDQPELDFGGKRNPDGQGFAAFGKVIKGMKIVKKIQLQKEEGQMLKPKIIINNIKRVN